MVKYRVGITDEVLQPEYALMQAMIDNGKEVHKVISAKQKI